MSEIEKMMQNAGIEPIAEYCKHQCNNEFDDDACIGCVHIEKVEYPPFTAEKQLKLIELFISSIWWENLQIFYKILGSSLLNFEDKLAKIVNYLWRSLSEEEKQSIADILKGERNASL